MPWYEQQVDVDDTKVKPRHVTLVNKSSFTRFRKICGLETSIFSAFFRIQNFATAHIFSCSAHNIIDPSKKKCHFYPLGHHHLLP